MVKDILISGVLGGIVMFLGLAGSLLIPGAMGHETIRPVPDQAEIHAALKERITEPGTYAVPYLRPEEASSFETYGDEPLYEIRYKGYTHNTVPGFKNPGVLAFLLAPMIATWLLSRASSSVLSRYSRRVLFVTVLGLFLAVGGDWVRALADETPVSGLAASTFASIVTWLLVGLVVAWRIRPVRVH